LPPVSLNTEITVSTISAGWQFSLAIKDDDTLWSWGWGNFGELGNGKSGDDTLFSPPNKIMNDVAYTVASYPGSAYAIKTDGSLWAWGYNQEGQLGDGTTENKTTPIKIMEDVVAVKTDGRITGGGNVLALKSDGSLWAWGGRKIGDGTAEARHAPVKILENVAAFQQGLAITTDGALYTWGPIREEPLANTDTLRPAKIMDHVISAGKWTYLNQWGYIRVVKSDGSLWELGHFPIAGTGMAVGAGPYVEPRKIMENVSRLVDADYVIDNDGGFWELTVFLSDYETHLKMKIDHVITASAGDVGLVAIRKDSSLWWAPNKLEEMKLTGKSVISYTQGTTSTNHLLFTKDDGSLWGMGHNNVRQLGVDPITQQISEPVRIIDNIKLPTTNSTPPTPTPIATPTASTVLVNGERVAFDAYNISGNNYFKLRDLAFILSNTEKQFDVGWDGVNNAISLTSGRPYTVVGGEMVGRGAVAKTPTATSSKIYLDGKQVSFTAYNIEGNNYFRLRDIGEAFNFGVDWDGANNTIVIDTSKGYTAD
jgi:alpha-tubulin suppressor-like RCC1 family protein